MMRIGTFDADVGGGDLGEACGNLRNKSNRCEHIQRFHFWVCVSGLTVMSALFVDPAEALSTDHCEIDGGCYSPQALEESTLTPQVSAAGAPAGRPCGHSPGSKTCRQALPVEIAQ